jgi:hypothetical protein
MLIWNRIKHFFGVHKYYKIKRLSGDSHLLGCELCTKRFAMNTNVKILIDWDQELEDFYFKIDQFEKLYKEKNVS